MNITKLYTYSILCNTIFDRKMIALTYGDFLLLYLVVMLKTQVAINSIPTVLTVALVTEGTS